MFHHGSQFRHGYTGGFWDIRCFYIKHLGGRGRQLVRGLLTVNRKNHSNTDIVLYTNTDIVLYTNTDIVLYCTDTYPDIDNQTVMIEMLIARDIDKDTGEVRNYNRQNHIVTVYKFINYGVYTRVIYIYIYIYINIYIYGDCKLQAANMAVDKSADTINVIIQKYRQKMTERSFRNTGTKCQTV